MNYKKILIIILASLFDIALSVMVAKISPIFLPLAVFYLSLSLSLEEAIIVAFLGGFIFDIALLDGSVFTVIFLIGEAVLIKILGRKIVDFTSRFTQMVSIFFILAFKLLFLYMVYDRALPSVFLKNNLLVIIFFMIIIFISYLLKSRYGKKQILSK
ncbi:MAG: hypothetical protein ABH810_00590 [bacterium]